MPLSRAASPSFDGRPGLSVPNYGSCHGAEVFDGRPMMPPVPVEKSALDQRAETMQRQGLGLGKRRSFWGVFSKKDIGRDGWIR